MNGRENTRLVGKFAPYIIIFGALFILLSENLARIGDRWLKFDESYSHGFLLLLVSIILVVKKLKTEPRNPGFYPWWLFPFFLALLGYALGGILRVEALQDLLLIPITLSAFAILLGWEQVRGLVLPVGVIFFAMPFWDYISWPLQLITVAVNEVWLGLLGIDFRIDGIYVYLTGIGVFEVAHGCSGLRYFLVGLSLSVLYGELNLKTILSRSVLMLAAVSLALLANWIRVFVIIYMGYETNMQSGLIAEHDNFGWWVFGVTLVPLFLFGRYLEKRETGTKNRTLLDLRKTSNGRFIASMCIAFLSMLAFFVIPPSHGTVSKEPKGYDLRLDGGKYNSIFQKSLEGWRPQINNPDRIFQQSLFETSVSYGNRGNSPIMYYASIHSYDFQRQGAEVIQYFNKMYNAQDWKVMDLFDIQSNGGRKLKGLTLEERGTGRSIHLAYGYYVEGYWEGNELRAKLAQLKGFHNSRTDASVFAFGVACSDCNGREALGIFIDDSLSQLVSAVDDHYQR
ncbi:exosortase [Marinobacter sp. bablab_jr008]|uniref:exosortase n=1 Tax=Marinobacter sp. bablab_jr008 TaxID=2755064 RepID=UPI0018F21713|nr:exosortase [Marinobacter sp. bablab_jr008]